MVTVYKSLAELERKQPLRQKSRQRVLVLCSRGVTYRHRHLLNDLAALLPHSRKDVKFDSKSKLYQLNELAELYNCNNALFFEVRKGQDLYMWMSKVPNGPAIKMHVQNLHTMEELHFTGNSLKGSRPILSFDSAFDLEPHFQLMKEMLSHIFGVPMGARRSKPFIDHVMGFTLTDGKIWVRNYQINGEATGATPYSSEEGIHSAVTTDASSNSRAVWGADIGLVEIGPRFVLTPIVIQEGSFGGAIIYENTQFISPNQVRSDLRKTKADRHSIRLDKGLELRAKRNKLNLQLDDRGDISDTKHIFA